jgi:hypothetical protein
VLCLVEISCFNDHCLEISGVLMDDERFILFVDNYDIHNNCKCS